MFEMANKHCTNKNRVTDNATILMYKTKAWLRYRWRGLYYHFMHILTYGVCQEHRSTESTELTPRTLTSQALLATEVDTKHAQNNSDDRPISVDSIDAVLVAQPDVWGNIEAAIEYWHVRMNLIFYGQILILKQYTGLSPNTGICKPFMKWLWRNVL